ncbi:MAG: VCBS repeat-containing protein, partial [Saprospiraceae bacterium]
MSYHKYSIFLLGILILLIRCQSSDTRHTLFTLLTSSKTGIDFNNKLTFSEEYNPYIFKNFLNGGGVAAGDINNDGLCDLYFTGNMVSNKLYLNKGDLKFEDITNSSGTGTDNVWSTGVSMADVNGDGWLDIYICKSGKPTSEKRHNELFLNNGDLTFREVSKEAGLDDTGLSTQAVFFDYDLDGDLDCYLLNNSIRSVGTYDLIKDSRLVRDTLGGNKLYRNDLIHFVDGKSARDSFPHYVDVSEEAGIFGSSIGFGLGVTVSDLNGDQWPDLYVSNDFFERDYLYINQKNGTFKECLTTSTQEISKGSMGADIADLNEDGWPEIFVTEMLPKDPYRYKTKAVFDNWPLYQESFSKGYYRQFGRNVLQLNRGLGPDSLPYFSEIGRFEGVEATEWSWGALLADFDNDGRKDIFVANGIFKDLIDLDYVNFYFNPDAIRALIKSKKQVMTTMFNA